MIKGLKLNFKEGIARRSDFYKRFGFTVFPEKRKETVEKYGLKKDR